MTERVASDQKLKELILLVCQRSLGDPLFDDGKLNRLLFLADFAAFGKFRQAMTWQEYQRWKSGPAPQRIGAVVRDMIEAGDLAKARHDQFGLPRIRPVALRDPNHALFNADEIALVTQLLEQFHGKDAVETDLHAHPLHAWRLAREGEMIPYGIALTEVVEETPADKQLDEKLRSKLLTLQESA